MAASMCSNVLFRRWVFSPKSSFLNIISKSLIPTERICLTRNVSTLSRRSLVVHSTLKWKKQILRNPIQNENVRFFQSSASLRSTQSPAASSKESETPTDQKDPPKNKWTDSKNAWKLGLILLGAWAGVLGPYILYVWGAPDRDDFGNEVIDEYSSKPLLVAYFQRAVLVGKAFVTSIKEPTSEKLLPDPLQPPYYQPPYTLVIELTGVLLHPDWTYETGWRFKKRPGLHYFLEQVGYPTFELVIFTQEPAMTAFPLIDNLDPNQRVIYRLFRDSTKYVKGAHIKDLSCLNRDLNKVIVVDWDEKAYQLHPRNALHRVHKWNGSDEDRSLFELADFLKMIAASGIEDVREVLDHYNVEPDPLQAFKERKMLLEQQRQQEMQMKEQKKKKSFGGLFGR